ncbi:MAG TPA: helix-turn-helix domain-containing protein [Nitrospirota bacterium]|nr:helix-turn-helix domain-containing protein [Nitrospirota bacterium]
MKAGKQKSAQSGKIMLDVVREKSSRDGTAMRILSAATRLFAAHGYDGTTTKDICQAAGANIAALHYHFGSKENLYHKIIEQFATERLDFARKTLQPPQNIDDFKVRLEIFLRQTLETMIKQKDIVRLIQQDVEMSDSKSKKMYLNTLLKHAEKLWEFFDLAAKKGIVDSDIKPSLAAAFLMSNIIHQTRNDKLLKEFSGHSLSDEKYRSEWIHQMLRIFIEGIIAKQSTK